MYEVLMVVKKTKSNVLQAGARMHFTKEKLIKLGVGCTFENSSENHTKVVHNMHGTHYPHVTTPL